jgi:hypothetical protein
MRMTQHHLHLCAWLVVVLSLASVVWNSRAVGSLKITSLTIFWCAFHHVSPFGCWPSSFSELLCQRCSGVNIHSSLCAIDVAKVLLILSTCSVTRNCPLTASGAWAKMAKNVCGFPQRPTVPPLPQKKVRATPASRATLQTSMVRSARST